MLLPEPRIRSKKVGSPMHYFDGKILLTILLMAAVTYLPRLLPLLFLSGKKLPAAIEIWLSYIPVAVLAALLGPSLFITEGKFTLDPSTNIYFWAAIPSFTVALLTKNMFFTVLAGIASASLLRFIL
jgi:branched-subunit amino acid transport protein